MEDQIMYLFEHPDFVDLIDQTATQIRMPFSFVEKDYWVTYVLLRLKSAGVDDFVFKGGTSLTKGWGLLDRFSEDIDLLFSPRTKSKDQKRTRLKRVNTIVSQFEGLTFEPKRSETHGHYRSDSFKYLRRDERDLGPLRPHIILEMGYRGGATPSELRAIQSYVGKQLEDAGQVNLADDVVAFQIPILDTRRTFIEKLFAIHSAFANNEIEIYFRHYYDVYKLLGLESVNDFIGSADFNAIKADVADMCREFPRTKIPEGLDFTKSVVSFVYKNIVKIISVIRLQIVLLRDTLDGGYCDFGACVLNSSRIESYIHNRRQVSILYKTQITLLG
jgi:predicted nucleotidyltransferase component of viral defense system